MRTWCADVSRSHDKRNQGGPTLAFRIRLLRIEALRWRASKPKKCVSTVSVFACFRKAHSGQLRFMRWGVVFVITTSNDWWHALLATWWAYLDTKSLNMCVYTYPTHMGSHPSTYVATSLHNRWETSIIYKMKWFFYIKHMWTHACFWLCTYLCVKHIHTCMCTYAHIYMSNWYQPAYLLFWTYVYIHTHMYIYILTYIHTYLHTFIYVQYFVGLLWKKIK